MERKSISPPQSDVDLDVSARIRSWGESAPGERRSRDRFVAAALSFAFLLLISIIGGVGYLGLRGMEKQHLTATKIASTQWENVRLATQALDYSNQNSRITMRVVMGSGDQPGDNRLLLHRDENDALISAILQRLEGRVRSREEQKLIDAVVSARAAYLSSARHATDLLRREKNPRAAQAEFLRVTAPLLARYHVAWSEFLRFQTAEMNEELEKSALTYAADRLTTEFLMALTVLLGLGTAAFNIYKTVTEIRGRAAAENALRQMNEHLEHRVAERTAALNQVNEELRTEICVREKAEESLTWKTAFLEAHVNSSVDGILVVDEHDHIILQNQRFIETFQIPADLVEADDEAPFLRFALEQIVEPEQFMQKVRTLYENREETSWDEVRLKNGTIIHRYSAPVIGEDGRYFGRLWTFRDITTRKRAEELAEYLAYHDALTNLPNRTLARDHLTTALASARRENHKVALLFLDLDRFKVINDSLGHTVGDLLLKQVAERLRGSSRKQDTVARVGGDEFLIVMSGVDQPGDASAAAQRITDLMRGEFVVQGHTLNVSCSIGVSIFPEHGTDTETLIKNADAAMYRAKGSGHNTFQFFTEEINAQVLERMSMETCLRNALDRDELFLEYQPQMEIETEAIIGVEALLRWHSPELGSVPPDKFIPVAENCGLIIPIGEWVLRTACAQARQWQDEGHRAVPIAVNVSAVQLLQEGFLELVKRVIQQTGLQPEYLELELTESVLLSNADVSFPVLQEMKDLGMKLAIDDFGTGYSSLSYLKTLPVNRLKIDRSFIRDVAVDPDDEAITTAIISMAKSLRLRVIAEGVETASQLAFLRAHRCDEIQGYYFSKPVSPAEIVRLMQHRIVPISIRQELLRVAAL